MENENLKDKTSLIPIGSLNLAKVAHSILITRKVLISDIEELFNRAFYLINSSDMEYGKVNHCLMLELDHDYHYRGKFKFEAADDVNFQDAIALFDQIIQIRPNHKYSFLYKAVALCKIEKYHEALLECHKAIDLDNAYSFAYNCLGNCRKELLDYEGAVDAYDKAIEINHLCPTFFTNRAIIKHNKADYDGAINDCTKAVEIDKLHTNAYFWRGSSKFKLGNYNGAIEDFTVIIGNEPTDYMLYYNRAICKHNLNDNFGAISDYTKAIELNPNDPDSYYYRGLVKFDLREYKEAIKDFNKTIRINPNHTEAIHQRHRTIQNLLI